jgi:integrase
MATKLPFSPADESLVLQAISKWHPRNKCLIEVGLNVGYRASELGSIRIGQVWDGTAVRNDVTVERRCLKGGRGCRRTSVRSRTVPFNSAARTALSTYLSWRVNKYGPLSRDAPLFPSTQSSNGLLRWRINALVRKAAEDAGLPNPERFGGHSMRKRFCNRVYEASGHNLRLTMLAMNHSQITTTQKYLFVEESAVRSAILAIGA